MSIKNETRITVRNVKSISLWGDLTFDTEDGSVTVELTDEKFIELAERMTKRAAEKKERKLEALREELEKAESEDS